MRILFNSSAVLLLFTSACSTAVPAAALTDEIALQASEAAEETAAQIGGNDSQAVDQSTGLPSISLGRPEFHASDPATFQVASGQVQLVEFFAYWCAVCKAMAPTVHGLEAMYGDRLKFMYLDRDDPATSVFQEQLGYVYQPHFFLLGPTGSVLGEWRGYVDGPELQRALLSVIQ